MLCLDPVSKALLLLSNEFNEFENELDSSERRVSLAGFGSRDTEASPAAARPPAAADAAATVPAVSAVPSGAAAPAAAATDGARLDWAAVASPVGFRRCKWTMSRLRMSAVLVWCAGSICSIDATRWCKLGEYFGES